MSMKSSLVYGYGFEIGEFDIAAFRDFLKNHKDTFIKTENDKPIYEDLMSLNTYDELNQYCLDSGYSCDTTGREGIGAVISNIMSRETGIRFSYEPGCGDCDSEASIVLAETQPWYMNEKEKALTEEDANKIFAIYAEELDIEEKSIDYQEIEYYG